MVPSGLGSGETGSGRIAQVNDNGDFPVYQAIVQLLQDNINGMLEIWEQKRWQ
ncbi:MAG: hypothetical protein Kow00111_24220 [Thermincola ferriacetica]